MRPLTVFASIFLVAAIIEWAPHSLAELIDLVLSLAASGWVEGGVGVDRLVEAMSR